MYHPKPVWLRKKLPSSPVFGQVRHILDNRGVHTVCQEAKCPNQWECFSRKTATFLILGARCTRDCRFCAVEHGSPEPVNPDEPEQVALAARDLELAYVVVTSVTRDDLSDGGANQFAEVISRIRTYLPEAFVEVLIPDFQGDWKNLLTVLQAGPDVVNHNIETVASLYPIARPGANYHRSLELLTRVREMTHSVPVKSGLMLGLGETPDEIEATLDDLIDHGCSLLTLGQYLQPSLKHLPVQDYLRPETFAFWKKRALEKGFWEVASGPFVRSSYKAHELYESFKR